MIVLMMCLQMMRASQLQQPHGTPCSLRYNQTTDEVHFVTLVTLYT